MDSSETSRGLLDGVDLVSASHLQTLLPADLLSQHIVHGNLADMINSQAQDYATHHRLEGQYLTDQYESTDLLSHADLTEEDRKLAAALVAVQLVQQQKQHCGQEGVIVNAKTDIVTSLPQMAHTAHSPVVIESLNNSNHMSHEVLSSSAMDEYDAQELLENDLADATVKLLTPYVINNQTITQIRLPPLKKPLSHSIRNIPLTRYNLINNHELSDPHTISSIITSNSTVQNTNLHNNAISSIRTSYANDISANSLDMQNKLLLHNGSTLDLTQQTNNITRLSNGISSSNINIIENSIKSLQVTNATNIHSSIVNTSDSNILTNSSHEHIRIVNAGSLVNDSTNSIKKSQQNTICSGNSLITHINGTIVKEELEFDIKCDEDDADALSEHLNALSNSRYAISDSDCSDVPSKRSRTSNNYSNSNSANAVSSSRSLPHKKRISRRLKTNNIKKSSNISANINSTCGTNVNVNTGGSTPRNTKKISNNSKNACIFSCQLCGERFEAQLKFFEHLKLHYEPPQDKEKFTSHETQYMEMNDMVNHENLDSSLLPTSLTEPHTILPNLDEDSLPTANLNELQDNCNSIADLSNAQEVLNRQHVNRILQTGHSINLDSLPNLVISSVSSLRCRFCPMSFKRQAALEGHMRDTHFKQEDHLHDEFSEPEDLMEGIRSVVEASGGHCSDDDVDDMKINLMQSTKNQRDWYQADELHATEVDLQEIEAAQQNNQNNQVNSQSESNICDNNSDFVGDQQLMPEGTAEETSTQCSFICAMCGETFNSREFYNDHEADCQLMMCDSDSEAVDSKSVLKVAPKLSCLQCDRQFNHRNSLLYHIQSHSEQRPYQCEICGNSFFATSALKVHMRRHSGDKPYQCGICEKFFRQWSDLKYHMVSIHTNERQYQCEFCGKDFARKYSLIVHRRIHTGEKNYKCEFCGKTFRASSYLQNHRRIHTGEKPYPCDICGKPFRVRGDMKRHMTTHIRDRGLNGAAAKMQLIKKEESKAEDIAKYMETEISTNQLPKITEVAGNHKLLQFASDESNTSTSKLRIPKLECPGPGSSGYSDDQQEARKSIDMQAQSICSDTILADESISSPAQPMNLNITTSNTTSKSNCKDCKECSVELQVHVTSETNEQNSNISETAVSTDQNLQRYSRNMESTENTRDGSTVYLWPVYMT